jgi:hypothetical protein
VPFLVQGKGLHPGLEVEVEGFPLTFRMLGPTLLLTEPFTTDVVPAQIDLVIRNGNSTTLSFKSVQAPADSPDISGIAPSTVKAGGPGFRLAVELAGQTQGGVIVEINGTPVTTFQQDGHRFFAEVPSSMIAAVDTLEVKVRAPTGNLTPSSRMLNVTATGLTTLPFLQPFGTIVRADGRELQYHTGGSFAGANAYVQWEGTPVRTLHMTQGLILSVPAELLDTAGDQSLVLINPPPLSTTQAAPTTLHLYALTDADCDKDTDAIDVQLILDLLVGGQPNINCIISNPDNSQDFQFNLLDAWFAARVVAGLE